MVSHDFFVNEHVLHCVSTIIGWMYYCICDSSSASTKRAELKVNRLATDIAET